MPARQPSAATRPVLDSTRPFLRADAVAAGVTDKQLRGPRYRRLLTGVYISARVAPHPLELVRAALLVHPHGSYASHTSAALLYRTPLPAGLDEVHVSVRGRADRRRRTGIRTHLAPADPRLVEVAGIVASAPAQCFVELATLLSLVDLVVVGDHFVAQGWVTPEQLVAHSEARGGRAAVRAARYVRRDVDSPMETRLRMLVVLAGLPEPQVNLTLRHADGRVRYRFDLSWPGVKVALEYDGRQHRADLDQWDHDVERDEWLHREGWRRLPVFSRGIYRRPDVTLERVAKLLRERGLEGVPVRLSEGWRPHFPVIR